MYGFMVNKYFVKVDKGLNKKEVVGGPVYSQNNSQEVVGKITDYNPRTGFMKIELIDEIDYQNLVRFGIPLSNIIFNNEA